METEPKSPRKRSTRLNIVDTAQNHIYQKGYSSTSYGSVAQETKLGKGNIQYHFNSKDELLKAVIERHIQEIREQLEGWSFDCGTAYDCIERFIDMIEDNAVRLSLYGCPMGTLNSELSKNERHLQHYAKAMFDLYLRWLEARFRSFLSDEEAKLRAEQLMVMAQGTSLLCHTYKDPGIVHRQSSTMRNWLAEICS